MGSTVASLMSKMLILRLGPGCDGSKISRSSSCCKNHAHVKCHDSNGCANYVQGRGEDQCCIVFLKVIGCLRISLPFLQKEDITFTCMSDWICSHVYDSRHPKYIEIGCPIPFSGMMLWVEQLSKGHSQSMPRKNFLHKIMANCIKKKIKDGVFVTDKSILIRRGICEGLTLLFGSEPPLLMSHFIIFLNSPLPLRRVKYFLNEPQDG